MSEPLDLVSDVPRADTLRGAPLGSLSSGYVRKGVSESGDLLAPRPNRHDNSFSDFCSPAPCLLRPLPPDQPTVKSLGALQQICEEEEDEEEGEVKPEAVPGRPALLPSTDLCSKPSRTFVQSETPRRTGRPKTKVGSCETLSEVGESEEGAETQENSLTGITLEHRVEKIPKTEPPVEEINHTEQPGRARDKSVGEHNPDLKINGPPSAPKLDVVQCCWGHREPSRDILENNNNAPAKSKLLEVGVVSTPCGSPRSLPRNHCVDLGPDGVEMRKTTGESEKPEEVQPKPQKGLQGTRDTASDPAIRADPNKVKNVNFRERLLQFPLCEKALSFNIQPTSKEKLLPFAQYNCCHVL